MENKVELSLEYYESLKSQIVEKENEISKLKQQIADNERLLNHVCDIIGLDLLGIAVEDVRDLKIMFEKDIKNCSVRVTVSYLVPERLSDKRRFK